MNIVAIQGSPRKDGKTAQALNMLVEDLVSKGHDVESIAVVDHQIKGCIGCLACHKIRDVPGCVMKDDDAPAIIDRLVAADAVIYASPLYAFDLSAQLKALIDRHNSICKWSRPDPVSLFEGKRVALLVTSGGADTEHVKGIFDLMFGRTLKATVIGEYFLPFSFRPDFGERARMTVDAIAADLTA